MKETTYNCPLCKTRLIVIAGTRINPHDGVTLRCNGDKCPTNENIEGHGRTVARAYDIVLSKYTGLLLQTEEPDDQPAEEIAESTPVIEISSVVKRGRPAKKLKVVAEETEDVPL